MACKQFAVHIAHGGRVVIPAKARQALGLAEGAKATLELHEDHLTIIPLDRSLDMLLAKAGKLLQGASLADDLIAERRREAEGE